MSVAQYYAAYAYEGRAFLPRQDTGYTPVKWIARDKHTYTLCSTLGSLKVIPATLSMSVLIVAPERPMHRSYVPLST